MAHHLSEVGEEEQKQKDFSTASNRSEIKTIYGCGNGPIDAFLNALDLGVHSYEERSLHQGSDAEAVAYVELAGTLFKEHCMASAFMSIL